MYGLRGSNVEIEVCGILYNTLLRMCLFLFFYVSAGVLFIGIVSAISIKGIKSGWRLCGKIALPIYLFLLLSATVIFRKFVENQTHNFVPFWSYKEILSTGSRDLLYQNIFNVLVFVPIGLLVGVSFKSIKLWQVFLLGFCVSASVELLQFVLKRGFAEFDDVFHNVVGCMIGFGIYKAFEWWGRVRNGRGVRG